MSGTLSRRDALRFVALGGVSIGLGGSLIAGLVRRGQLTRVRRTEEHMGTLVSILVLHPDADVAHETVAAAFAEITVLERVLSRHDSNTAVALLNRRGALTEPPKVLVDVLKEAQRMSVLTEGAFDVTVAPLLEAVEEGYRGNSSGPSDEALSTALSLVGFEGLAVGRHRIALDKPGMGISLDGIAKGYIVDCTVESMVARGFDEVLIDAGGDVASAGSGGDGTGWGVGVESPRQPGEMMDAIRLHGTAIATSGDYMQAYTEDRSAHHIVDPRTGRSPESLSSVSIRARSAMEADALSTSALVLGLDQGLELLDGLPGIEGLFVGKDGSISTTEGWSTA